MAPLLLILVIPITIVLKCRRGLTARRSVSFDWKQRDFSK